jgi:hypothetical protein
LSGDQLDYVRRSLTKTQDDHDREPRDVDRDPDGVISDEQVDKDIAALNLRNTITAAAVTNGGTTKHARLLQTKALAGELDWPKDLFGNVEPPAPIPIATFEA